MRSIDRSHLITDNSYHLNSGIYGSTDTRDRIRRFKLNLPSKRDPGRETVSSLSATFRTTRSVLNNLPPDIVPSKNLLMKRPSVTEKFYLPDILNKKTISKVASRSMGPVQSVQAVESTTEDPEAELSLDLKNSQRRLMKLKKNMISKQSGLSRNLRRKLHAIADMDVLKNRKEFKKEVDLDPKHPDKFKFYKFVKTDVDLSLQLKQHTVAVQDYLLTELEISHICNHIYKFARYLGSLVLDRVMDHKHCGFMWNKLAKMHLPDLKLISLSGGDNEIAKIIQKYLVYAFSELTGPPLKLHFHAQDFHSRSMVDLIGWENLFLKTHLLELINLEITNSYMFERMIEESSHRFTGLRWLTLRKSPIKVRFFGQTLKDLKGLQVLTLNQCDLDQKDLLMNEIKSVLKHCTLLDTLRITKCKLQQNEVESFLLDCFRTNEFDLRCVDLSQNCVFAENLITNYGDMFVYFMINSSGQYLSTQYIEETWNDEIFETLYSKTFSNILFYKQKHKDAPKLSFGSFY